MQSLLYVNLQPKIGSRLFSKILVLIHLPQVLAPCRRLAALDISFNAERAHLRGLERLTALRSLKTGVFLLYWREFQQTVCLDQGLSVLGPQSCTDALISALSL